MSSVTEHDVKRDPVYTTRFDNSEAWQVFEGKLAEARAHLESHLKNEFPEKVVTAPYQISSENQRIRLLVTVKTMGFPFFIWRTAETHSPTGREQMKSAKQDRFVLLLPTRI